VNFSDDSTVQAVGTGSITLHTIIGKQIYEIILSNVLHIPDLHLTLLSVSHFTQAGLSTLFLANTYACEIRKGGKIVLMGTHRGGLYHVQGCSKESTESACAAIDINLLHRRMGHISTNQIRCMVKEGQLEGVDAISGNPKFCE
jgi:hypothetical protein